MSRNSAGHKHRAVDFFRRCTRRAVCSSDEAKGVPKQHSKTAFCLPRIQRKVPNQEVADHAN